VTAADVNGDGALDLVAANGADGVGDTVSVLHHVRSDRLGQSGDGDDPLRRAHRESHADPNTYANREINADAYP